MTLPGAMRALPPMLAALALVACSGDGSKTPSEPDLHGSVQFLTDADTILVHDQLGSVLAEASGNGTPSGRFASYAYGVSRYSTSQETRLFAGHSRDRGVGLDMMGARFYAPDLGVWTAADPGLLNSPERGAGGDFGAVNAYAYVGLNPIGARDPNGEFLNFIAGVVGGAAVGALVGGGLEAARQYMANGKVEDWGRVGAAAAGGAVAGATFIVNPAAGYAAVMAMGAVSGVAGGATTRLVESGGKSAGSLADVVGDAVVGAASAGVVKGGAAVLSRVAKAVAPRAAQALGKLRALTSEKVFQKQYKQLGQAASAAIPELAPGPGSKMLGEAVGHLRGMAGSERVAAFEQFAGQITKATKGQWSAKPCPATNAKVFAGEGGEALVFDGGGKMFRGNLMDTEAFVRGAGLKLEVAFDKLRPL